MLMKKLNGRTTSVKLSVDDSFKLQVLRKIHNELSEQNSANSLIVRTAAACLISDFVKPFQPHVKSEDTGGDFEGKPTVGDINYLIRTGIELNLADAVRMGELVSSQMGFILGSSTEKLVNNFIINHPKEYKEASLRFAKVEASSLYAKTERNVSNLAIDYMKYRGLEKSIDIEELEHYNNYFSPLVNKI